MGELNDRGREAKGKACSCPPPRPLDRTFRHRCSIWGRLDGLSNLISVWHAINKTSRRCAVRINKCTLAQRLEHSKQGRRCTRTTHPEDENHYVSSAVRWTAPLIQPLVDLTVIVKSREGLICLSANLKREGVCFSLGIHFSTTHMK